MLVDLDRDLNPMICGMPRELTQDASGDFEVTFVGIPTAPLRDRLADEVARQGRYCRSGHRRVDKTTSHLSRKADRILNALSVDHGYPRVREAAPTTHRNARQASIL